MKRMVNIGEAECESECESGCEAECESEFKSKLNRTRKFVAIMNRQAGRNAVKMLAW